MFCSSVAQRNARQHPQSCFAQAQKGTSKLQQKAKQGTQRFGQQAKQAAKPAAKAAQKAAPKTGGLFGRKPAAAGEGAVRPRACVS